MDNLKDKLNNAQLAAVTTMHGAILVIAGAGSGKTRAIEYRVSHLVRNNVAPESILLLTFTRKAAHEMVSRACRHDPRCKNIDGGTFHSFAFKTLKKYAKALGLSNLFTILDESDANEAVHACAARLKLFDAEKKFPRKDTLRAILSASINKAQSIAVTLEKEYPHFLEFTSDIEKLRKEYAAYKIDKGYLDYDDLLVYLKMLLDIDEVRASLAARYKFVMVDEYQDTNKLQGEITYLLAKENGNVMIVGDDAQSIYGFRGSSHRNIMEFPKMFAQCTIIKLEENYRSTQSILDTANAILENMEHKYSKCLIATRKDVGEKPRLNFFKNPYDEAAWIVDKINELRSQGVDLSQQAVLFRAAYASIPLQAELSKNGIAYQVFGGLKFYETAHVKDVTAHMKVVMNPRDEIAWARALMLIEGVGPKTAERIVRDILTCSSLKEVAERVLEDRTKLKALAPKFYRLSSYLKSAAAFKLSPGALYDLALDYYQPLMKEKFDDWHLRTNDLEALRQISARYDSVEDLLADFAIESPERSVLKVESASRDQQKPITLSTIHSAKGLEWDCVFLLGVADGVLPSSFALDNTDDLEEESRLFYVAITRARNNLYLSMHHEGMRSGITQFNKISRFVDTANVLASLDQEVVFERSGGLDIDLDDSDDITPYYNKKTLLKKLMDRY